WLGQADAFSMRALITHVRMIVKMTWVALGPPLAGLAAMGVSIALRGGPRWRAMIILFVSGLIFHAVVNVPAAGNYLLAFILPVVACAGVGLDAICRLL